MEKLTVYKLLDMLEGEAGCIQNYEDYRIAIDRIDELKEIFDNNGFRDK